MAWTIRQVVEQAHAEIGMAAYVYDLQPEQLQTAARALQAMVLGWETRGVRLGFTGGTDLEADSGIPDRHIGAVYALLACRIAPGYGKTPSPDTKIAAADGWAGILRDSVKPREQQFPGTLPMGAGNRSPLHGERFFPEPTFDPLAIGDSGELDIAAR
jgi:hypothetical protein